MIDLNCDSSTVGTAYITPRPSGGSLYIYMAATYICAQPLNGKQLTTHNIMNMGLSQSCKQGKIADIFVEGILWAKQSYILNRSQYGPIVD